MEEGRKCWSPGFSPFTTVFKIFTLNVVLLERVSGKSKNTVNPVPNNKILDWSNSKAFADDEKNLSQKLEFVFGRVENIVGKGENVGYQHFLLFPLCFQKAFS